MGVRRANSDKMISVVAPYLQQPIADCVAKLIVRGFQPGDRLSANFYENGYSVAAILLLAAMLESMLQRDRYFLRQSNRGLKVSRDSSTYLKDTLQYRRHSHVRELFDVRNALAHNHMWEVEYTLSSIGNRVHRRSTLTPESHRLQTQPNSNARIPRTRTVKFNLVPNRIDRTDLVKALDVSNHAFMHLHRKEQRPVGFLANTAICGKQRLPFKKLAEVLRNEIEQGDSRENGGRGGS